MSNTWTGETVYSRDFTRLMRDIADLNGKNPLITAACADEFYFYFLDQYARKIYKVFKAAERPIRVINLTDETIIYQRSWLANGTLDGSEWDYTRACWADDSTGVFGGRTYDMKRWHISRWTIHVLGNHLVVSEPIESTCYVYTKAGEYVTQFCIGWAGVSGNGQWGNGRFAHILAVEEPDILYVSHNPYFGIRGASYQPISSIIYTRKYTTIDGMSYSDLWGEAVMPRGHHDQMLAWPEDDPAWLNSWNPDWYDDFVTDSPYFSKWTLDGEQLEHATNKWHPRDAVELGTYIYTDANGGNDWFSPKFDHVYFRPTGGCLHGDYLYVSAAGGYDYGADDGGLGTQHAVYAIDKNTLKIESIACGGSDRFFWGFVDGFPVYDDETDGSSTHLQNWLFDETDRYGFTWTSDTLLNCVADASIGCFVHPYHTGGGAPALVNISNCGWVTDTIVTGRENKVPNIHQQMHWLWPSTLLVDEDTVYVIVNRMPWWDHAVNTGTVWDDAAGGTATIAGRSEVDECYMISYDLTSSGAEWSGKTILRVRAEEQAEWHKYTLYERESIGNSPEDDALVGSVTSVENLMELRSALADAAASLRTPYATFLRYYKDEATEIEQPYAYYPLFGPADGEGEDYCIGESGEDTTYAEAIDAGHVIWSYDNSDRACYLPLPEDVTTYSTIFTAYPWIHSITGPFDGGPGGISLTSIMFTLPDNDGPLRIGTIVMDGVEYVVVQAGAPGSEDRDEYAASEERNVYYLSMGDVETEYGLAEGTVAPTSTWRRPERSDAVGTPTYDIDIGELREVTDYLLARNGEESIMVIEPTADADEED